jgi:hypothetical protein
MANLTPEQYQQNLEFIKQMKAETEELSDANKALLAATEAAVDAYERQSTFSAEILENAQEAVKVMREQADSAESSYARGLRLQELERQTQIVIGEQLKQIREKLKLTGEIADEEAELLKTLEAQADALDAQQTAQKKNQAIIDGTGDAFQQKLVGAAAEFHDLLKRPIGEKMQLLTRKMGDLATGPLNKFVSLIKETVFNFDSLTKGFERQFQLGEQYTKSIEEQYVALNEFGVSMEDAVESQSALITGMTDFTMLSKSQRDSLTETSAILNELGVAQADFAKGMQNSVKFFGQSADEAEGTGREIAATARALGRAPGELAAEFAAAGNSLAKFGDQGVKAFKDLAHIQKITGMEMQKVLNITNRFDTFEGAAEQAGKLNAALGGNMVNAMDLMMTTDPAERFGTIRDSILDAGLSFDTMSYYQKQFYAESLGLSDVGDLALMLSGDMDALGGAANKTAEQLIEEKERAKEVQSAQEELAIMGQQLAEAFLPLANVLQKVTGFLSENLWIIKMAIPLMVAMKVASMGLAAAKTIQMMATWGLVSAETAQAATGKKAAITLGLIALALAGLVYWLMIQSPSKVVLALFGLAAAIFAISRVGETGAASLQALAVPLMQIGVAVFLVAAGMALMAGAFSLLSNEQMIGMGAALVLVGVGLYFLAPAISAAGIASVAASPGLGILALTILAIGASVGIAAAGIGLMAAGFALMFESIDVKKVLAFAGFVAALVLGAPYMIAAGIGLAAMGAGMIVLGLGLMFVSTRDLEAIATFTSSLAELEVKKVTALADALEKVAKAMDDIPTAKAISLTATMRAASVASKAAESLAGRTTNNQASTAGKARSSKQPPINVHVTMTLDGEVLDRKIIKVTEENQHERDRDGILGWA